MSILNLLDRPIAYHRPFAAISGSVCGGVFLSQAFYWSQRTSDPDGWFWKTQEQWFDETFMTRYEQEAARKKLIAIGVLEQKRQGLPAKLFYRIDRKALEIKLQNYADKYVEFPHTCLRETSRQVCGKPADNLYTENTSETTSSLDQDCGKASIESESEPDRAQKEALAKQESDQVNEDLEKKPVHKGRRRSKETPKHEPEAFEIWWKKYYAFCLSIDHEPGSRKETVPLWDEQVAEGCLDEIIEGTDWYILCKTRSYASKDRSALAVPHGIRYLFNRKWKEALDHKRLKAPTIAHSAETENKPIAPTQAELLARAQQFIDLGWIKEIYYVDHTTGIYPESRRLRATTKEGFTIPQERWSSMLEDLHRDLQRGRVD